MRDILLMLVIAAESHSQSQQGGSEEAFLRLLLFCRRLCRFFAGCYDAVSSSPQERPGDPLEDVRAACTVRLRNWRANAAAAAAAGAADDDDFRVEV